MKHEANEAASGFEEPQQVQRRKFLAMSGALGAAALAISVPGVGRVFAAESKKVGFEFATFTVPRYVRLDLPTFQKAVAAAGYTTVSLQADSKVDRQMNDVQNLLGQQVRALTLMAVTGESGISLARQCKEAGVPLVAYNQEILSPDVSAFVARDNVDVGVMMAKGAESFLGGKLKGNFVLVSGQPGDGVALGITKGYMQVLQPAIDRGDVKIISHEFNAGWDPESARKQVENSLTKTNNSIQAILCNNDGMAGGAIAALRAQGLAGKVYVCGLDATNEACRSILLGEQAMSVFTKYDEMAMKAAELTVSLSEGKKISSARSYPLPGGKSIPFFPTESYVIDKSNIAGYLKRYSPAYVDIQAVVKGVPADKIPPTVAALAKS